MTKKSKKNSSKKSKKHVKQSPFKLIKIFSLIFLFAFLSTSLSYFIMQNENSNKSISPQNDILEKEPTKIVKKEDPIKDFQDKKLNEYFNSLEKEKNNYEEYTEEFNKDYIDKEEVKEPIPKPKKELKVTPLEEEKELIKETKPQLKVEDKKVVTKRDLYKYDGNVKPKIAIVIDDVSSNRQKQNILNLGYKINMAFLPPTKGHPNSARIAQDLAFKMIHFPMQASSKFKGAEKGTITINDSYEKIEKRVKQLRDWYPDVKYTNNHTGSVFTQNEEAMDKLFRALKKYNFIFVDSRTTPNSVAKRMAKKYDMPYIVRNTFMDNEKDYAYIQNQLKKAIKIAKKRGYAIAIGHPYPITIKVLRESKHLLKDLEPIYINQLPYLN